MDIKYFMWLDIMLQNDTYVYNSGQISDSNTDI